MVCCVNLDGRMQSVLSIVTISIIKEEEREGELTQLRSGPGNGTHHLPATGL